MIVAQLVAAAVLLQVAVSGPVSYYKPLTEEDAARLAAWTPESKQQMWELSGQYEGDMILTPNQRHGVVDTSLRWANREIPYEFANDFTEAEKDFIMTSLTTEYAKTCITPRLRQPGDTDYIRITGQNTGCWSWVGRSGGVQEINLQKHGCFWTGIVVHEFLHALGFYHQQSATERDDWVDIIWENIQPGKEDYFAKYPANMVTSFGQQYDYSSVMHSSRIFFSKNFDYTIVTKDPNASIGQRAGLSNTDIIKLNKMYNCA